MNIVIISEFCDDFSQSDNDRFLYLAKMLTGVIGDNKKFQDCQDSVEIITSSFRHTTKKHRRSPVDDWPFKITFIEEPGYTKNVCLKRFYSHYIWGKNLHAYLKNREKPDVVYCAVPSLTGSYLVARYCEKNNIRFIIDVQDLWPEAFRMVFNIPIISSIVFAPFKMLADAVYKRADAICAVSETYCNRALSVNKKCKTGTVVYLGTDLDKFDRYAAENQILKKNPGEIWLAYCGTLGASYDLKIVFDALRILNDRRIKFIIMGDGPQKEEFVRYSGGLNTVFTGRLSYEQMCSIIKACDIAVNPIAHLAAQSIINKHADYAASGLPVLNTQENEEYKKLVCEYKMGFNVTNNDVHFLAKKLKDLVENKDLRMLMGNGARKCAIERFDRTSTYNLLEEQILVSPLTHKNS